MRQIYQGVITMERKGEIDRSIEKSNESTTEKNKKKKNIQNIQNIQQQNKEKKKKDRLVSQAFVRPVPFGDGCRVEGYGFLHDQLLSIDYVAGAHVP